MKPYAEVIGDPIAHSKSPLIHGFWLEKLGIDAHYRATHVTAEGLADYFVSRRADPAWRGCNITIPHKLAALDHAEDRGDVRATIGAINCALRDGDALIGTNTDAGGFYAPIADLDLTDRPVVVIGAGAARAILFALSRVGVGRLTILNRSPLKGAALLAVFGLKGDALPLTAKLPPAALLVNTSALGMIGQPPLDLDLTPLPEDAVVYDIVYAPLETPLLRAAAARGLDTVDGLQMLVGQAAIAFELLFGVAPPEDCDDELRAADGMMKVGLTGSIGMGKSTVAAMFADEGVPVFDADAAVHRLQGPAGKVVAAIEARFPGTTGEAGVNRTALAEAVLGDDTAIKALEAIVHPAVGAERAAFLSAYAAAPLVVFDIPLLFETGGEKAVDSVVVVSAAADVQRARTLGRPGMTDTKFAAILARQIPDAEKRARADFVIPTDVPLDETRRHVRRVIACLLAHEGG